MTTPAINGIHHITALACDPQRNLDFYVGVLGLRLVKRTVNFDAPDVYHFYYGDEVGQPGTILTFFPFPDAVQGKRGAGEVSAVAFAVPASSLDYWIQRLSSNGIHIDGPNSRFSDELISFQDPDGLTVELVLTGSDDAFRHWGDSPVPKESAIRRIHGATLQLRRKDETDWVLRNILGFHESGQSGNRVRYHSGQDSAKAAIDLVIDPSLALARQSAGSVHHIAWRVADDEGQKRWRQILVDAGIQVTEILDRSYFRSIYFREPGGVLFEIATDSPGFAVDESVEDLGTQLKLPAWLEPQRHRLERQLPPIELMKLRSSAH